MLSMSTCNYLVSKLSVLAKEFKRGNQVSLDSCVNAMGAVAILPVLNGGGLMYLIIIPKYILHNT